MRLRHTTPLVALVALLTACSAIGAADITVTARNTSDVPMVVGVVEGGGAGGPAFGQPITLLPGQEGPVTLRVPGGAWTVTVNGALLLTHTDAGSRRGELPVTLVLPADDEPPGRPHWLAPSGWAGAGP
jgi:hypothetical protein